VTTDDPTVAVPADETGKVRIVIAEDEALIRLDLKEMLQEEGYDVVGEAGDGETACTLAEQLQPDIVLMDVKMPILDGISAAERIIEARIAPVLILTAFSQRSLIERARDAGAMSYIVKPFTKSDLIPAIEMAVSRYAEMHALEDEVADLSQRLETRKLVDRAKAVLQSQYGLNESAAFRWIQKTSMDRRLTMRAVAEAVVAEGQAKDDTSAAPSASSASAPSSAPAPGNDSSV
jgi:response regulator NasT